MNWLKYEAAGVLGAGLLGGLFLTTRFKVSGRDSFEQFRARGQPVIFVFWHGQLLPLVHYHRNEGVVVLVSEHGDGEYVTKVIERNGFSTVRGSSTRGGTKGLKGLVRAAKSGRDLALTPDGPRGPHGVFKPGALAVAQMTGAPLIPLAAGTTSGWHFRSWDGFLVPRPFASISVEYLPARFVPRGAGRAELEALAGEIGRDLNECTARLNPRGWFPSQRPASADPGR